jgi:hypothetical protein
MSETLYPHEQIINFFTKNGNGLSILSALCYALSGAILLASYIYMAYGGNIYFIVGISFIIMGYICDYKSRWSND